MKVISVEEEKSFCVTTDEGEYNVYRREKNGGWWHWLGGSLEEAYDEEKLETAFQEFVNNPPNPLKDFVDFCVDNGVDNGIHEMMDKFLKKQ